jgi:hypothetical protein
LFASAGDQSGSVWASGNWSGAIIGCTFVPSPVPFGSTSMIWIRLTPVLSLAKAM